jgi:hypothetical protein
MTRRHYFSNNNYATENTKVKLWRRLKALFNVAPAK